MANLQLSKTTQVPATYTVTTNGTVVESPGRTFGGDFSVQTNCVLKSLGWSRALTLGQTIQCGVWSPTTALLASGFITQSGVAALNLPLLAGVVYRCGFFISNGYDRSSTRAAQPGGTPAPPYPVNILGSSMITGGTSLVYPPTVQPGWIADPIFNIEYPSVDTRYEPPEPVIEVGARQFIVSLPVDSGWIDINQIKEWELQYQQSDDNSTFGNWINIGTLPVSERVYTHSSLSASEKPYYRYRYRITTINYQQSDWSEAAIAGQVREAGSVTQGEFDPDDPGGTGAGETEVNILTAQQINAVLATISGTLTATNANVSNFDAGDADITDLSAGIADIGTATIDAATIGELTATNLHISDLDLTNLFVSNDATIGHDLNVAHFINGNVLGPGVFNGVTIQNGNIGGQFITAHSITSDQVATDFLDANISVTSYLDASAIQGGELSLGGTRKYQNFRSSAGTLLYPWSWGGTVVTDNDITYPGGPAATPSTMVGTVGTYIRVDFVNGTTLAAGKYLDIFHQRPEVNKIKELYHRINQVLPTNVTLQLVDQNGVQRPIAAPYTKTGTYVTASTYPATESPNLDADGDLPAGIAFRIKNTSAGTVTFGSGQFFEVQVAEFEYEKGYGTLTIYDEANRLRAEMTANYIRFNKPLTINTTENVFTVDNNGVWVPEGGFTIGSTDISNLYYNQRDLSGGLLVNPRFENLRPITRAGLPGKIPSDWNYFIDSGVEPNTSGIIYTNYVSNPNFEVDLATWTNGNTVWNTAVRQTSWSMSFTSSVRLTKSTPWSGAQQSDFNTAVGANTLSSLGLAVGDTLSAAGEWRIYSVTGGPYMSFRVSFLDGAGGYVGGLVCDAPTTGAGTGRATGTATIPAGCTQLQFDCLAGGTGATLDCAWDNLIVTKTPSPVGYFDGSTHPHAAWTGTAHNSRSVMYERWEDYIDYKEGVIPQWQSLVSGRVLKMILPISSTATKHIYAVSHKRSVAVIPTQGLPQLPFSMYAFYRTPINRSDIGVKMHLYASTSSADIADYPVATDTLLGTATANGGAVSAVTTDGQVLFQPVQHSYQVATGANEMVLTQSRYVYVVLEAYVISGTLDTAVEIEWDNADLTLSERPTPSDTQPIADLARRVTDLQTIFEGIMSGTKAVLPEQTSPYNQGLAITVVT